MASICHEMLQVKVKGTENKNGITGTILRAADNGSHTL
jgi:hypothetical protein